MYHRPLYIAAYDVRAPKRLTQALRLVRNHATGGQKSVHEIFLTAAEKVALLKDMRQLLETEDRFMLLRLDTRSCALTRGLGKVPAETNYFYLG